MNTLLALALLAGSVSVHATDPPTSPAEEQSAAERLSPELVRLDQVLTLAQRARDEGRLPPERYDAFQTHFRESLEKARAATPPSPTATALYARILARLGEPQQAADALEPALEADPGNAELRVALGHLRYQQRDYAAALVAAEAVLERAPGNQAALALKYLSKGRSSGDASPAPNLPPSGMESPSVLQDPRLQDAGLKAMGRRNALQYTDEAMRRIKIRDPQEALRYLALAEASDSRLPDVPMQQGIAHHALKQRPEAMESFGRAESLWRAQGTTQGDQLADVARQGLEAAERLTAQTPTSSPVPDPPPSAPPPWAPLAAGGLLLTTLGAYGIHRSRSAYTSESGLNPAPAVAPDQESRNWFAAAKVVGVGLVALATWEFGPGAFAAARTMFIAAGPSLTPVGAGATVTLEPALAIEGTKALGAAVAITGGASLASDGYSYAKGNAAAEARLGDADHPHGLYEGSPKHGAQPRGSAKGNISKAPQNPQEVLDESIRIKETSSRRVGIDHKTGEFNIFSETEPRKWHGFAMSWDELGVEARNALINAGRVTRKGRIIKP